MSVSSLEGKTLVVKMGGHAMSDPSLLQQFASDVKEIADSGARVVVTHGGGPQIDSMLGRLDLQSRFVNGFRYTDEQTMNVVRMVLTGEVQRHVVNALNVFGPAAVGLSGEDAGLLVAEKREISVDGQLVDLGLVGEVVETNIEPLTALLDAGYIAVVSGLASGRKGETFNLNADTAAAALALALKADRMVLLTDVDGLFADWPMNQRPIRQLSLEQLDAMLPGLAGGMVPKMEACRTAVSGGVAHAHVIDGRVAHALSGSIDGSNEGTVVSEHGR